MAVHLEQTQNFKGLEHFWQVIQASREERDGKSSITLLPVFGKLALHYAHLDETDLCAQTCERVRLMNKRDLNHAPAQLALQCVDAMLAAAEVYPLPKWKREHKVLCDQVIRFLRVKETDKEMSDALRIKLGEHLRHGRGKTDSFFSCFAELNDATLANFLDQIKRRWPVNDVIAFTDNLIKAKERIRGRDDYSLMSLLYTQVRQLESDKRYLKCEEIFSRIFEVEKANSGNSAKLRQHQISCAEYLTRGNSFTLATITLRDALETAPNIALDDKEVDRICCIIDELNSHRQSSHERAIDLTIALVSLTAEMQPPCHDRITKTTTAVLYSCLTRCESIEAEMLLDKVMQFMPNSKKWLHDLATYLSLSKGIQQFSKYLDKAIGNLAEKNVSGARLQKLRQFLIKQFPDSYGQSDL